MEYLIGDKIIISISGSYQIGIITKVMSRGGMRLYDVKTELGSEFYKIDVDNKRKTISFYNRFEKSNHNHHQL